MKLIFYVPTISQYILNVMVADYCSIFFCKCATNVVGVNGDFIVLANISRKYTKYKQPGSRIPGFVQMNLN